MKNTLQKSLAAVTFLAMGFAPMMSFAQTDVNVTATATTKTAKKTVDVPCIQNAIETRDTAIMAAFGTFSTSINASLMTRKDALKASYTLSTKQERSTAHKAAWNAYKTANNAAHSALKSARKSAWTTFDASRKVCKDTEKKSEGSQANNNATMSL